MENVICVKNIFLLRDLAVVVCAAAISIIDIKTYRIPDKILLFLFFVLFLVDVCAKEYWVMIFHSASAFVFFSVFFAVYYFKKNLGFGDVKYVAVLAYWLGFKNSYIAVVIAVFAGILIFAGGHIACCWCKNKKLPFAPLLSLGAVLSAILNYFSTVLV